MKIIKKGLDELQKQILLGIESRGFWIAFWGSLILLIVQMIFANNIISVISSWLLFMVLAIYEAVSCLKAGIWNNSLYISKKRNAFISSIIAICMGVFQFILVSQRGESTYKTIIVLVPVIAVTFFLCFSAIIIIAKAVKKRRDKLDAEPDDTMDKQ